MSFIADRVKMDGLTFDDVLLIPAYSEVLPREVSLKTRFSRNISLNAANIGCDGHRNGVAACHSHCA